MGGYWNFLCLISLSPFFYCLPIALMSMDCFYIETDDLIFGKDIPALALSSQNPLWSGLSRSPASFLPVFLSLVLGWRLPSWPGRAKPLAPNRPGMSTSRKLCSHHSTRFPRPFKISFNLQRPGWDGLSFMTVSLDPIFLTLLLTKPKSGLSTQMSSLQRHELFQILNSLPQKAQHLNYTGQSPKYSLLNEPLPPNRCFI